MSVDQRAVHAIFEEQAALRPDDVAVTQEDKGLTYRELNRRANKLARYLQRTGVIPGTLVGLFMERSPEMVVGLLAILKAGAAYVPLDPKYPSDWLKFVLDDIHSQVLLTQRHLSERLAESGPELLCLDVDSAAVEQQSDQNLALRVTGEQLAYVIYTSGSTGTPKGVEIPHNALVNYIVYAGQFFGLRPADRLLQFASISFDTAAEEIFSCLTRGATLVLRTDSMLGTVAEFLEICGKWRITVLDLPTAYWHELTARISADGLALPDPIRLVVIGGERALPERLAQWRASIGNRIRLCNGYGPTEATIVATFCELTDIPENGHSSGEVPIGRPIPNVQLYVLDQNLAPVPAGVPGELFIGGQGLARGYLNRPELTAEKFISNPFVEEPDARLYRTGDLVRFRSDGNFEFLKRIDNQVKIRGHRVETEEIEAVLRSHPAIWEALVIAREDVGGDKKLIAYVVFLRSKTSTGSELRNFLKAKLPDYMVPSAFVVLGALPLTPNGKIDHRALPAPDQTWLERTEDFVAPRNPLELRVTKIWENLLGPHPIGVNDNFFDLGGHSLLAGRLMAQIEKNFGKKLSLAAFFQAPTIAQVARLLSQEVQALSWSSLIPLQPNGSKPPFFWVHGEASDAFLPRYLGSDQPLYGFMHQSLDGRPALYISVEDIAAHYLSEIRSVQPHGPYFLGGYCFGGLVALEMARQLRQRNEPVALLAMLEPVNLKDCKPSSPGSLHGQVKSTSSDHDLARSSAKKSFRDEVARHLSNLKLLRPKEKLGYLLARVNGKIKDSASTIARPLHDIFKKVACRLSLALGYPLPPSLRSHYILAVYEQAMRDYLPPVHSGPLVVFISADDAEEARSWEKLAVDGLEIHPAPGNHTNVLREPHVGVWSQQLKICLKRAQSSVHTPAGNGSSCLSSAEYSN